MKFVTVFFKITSEQRHKSHARKRIGVEGRELQLSIIPQAIKKLYAKVAQLVEQ